MIEKRAIKRVWRCVNNFDFYPISLRQAFLEMVLNVENQKEFPETEGDIQKLTRIVFKVKKQLICCSK